MSSSYLSPGGRHHGAGSKVSFGPEGASVFTHGLRWLILAMRTISTRRELAEMDGRMLKDVGLSRSDAVAEAGRAPWDIAPTKRQR